ISLSQGISLIYNTFFDNNDFDHYKTLPIPLNLVILSKSFITVFTIIIYLFPCLAAFINYSLHSGTNPVLAIILSIFLWIVLIVFIFLRSEERRVGKECRSSWAALGSCVETMAALTCRQTA